MQRTRRLIRIKQLIQTYDIETQDELANRLREEGFDVTQATVSRDIKALGLVKVPLPGGGYKYALPQEMPVLKDDRLRRLMLESFRSLAQTGNLLVLKSDPGNANAFGAVLDELAWPGLMGTICGDDTCLLICQDEPSANDIRRRLERLEGTD